VFNHTAVYVYQCGRGSPVCGVSNLCPVYFITLTTLHLSTTPLAILSHQSTQGLDILSYHELKSLVGPVLNP